MSNGSDYRQLGSPRFQPQQQIGGFSSQAPRDLGAEQALRGFAGLSQSFAQAGQRLNKEDIERSLAEGEAGRKQSKKTFREAVRDGDIHPTQNPHYALASLRVDGHKSGRKQVTKWISEWEQETQNPESTAARTQGGFESFMQERIDGFVEENPFHGHYDQNSFYDVVHHFVGSNAIQQNSDALERDQNYNDSKNAGNILSLLHESFIPPSLSLAGSRTSADMERRTREHDEALRGWEEAPWRSAQGAYDTLYENGALNPAVQNSILESAYLTALSADMALGDISPQEYMDRVTGLTQNGATLGNTSVGQTVYLKYKARLETANTKWDTRRDSTNRTLFAGVVGNFENFTKFWGNSFDLWESNLKGVSTVAELDQAGGVVQDMQARLRELYLIGEQASELRNLVDAEPGEKGKSSKKYLDWLADYNNAATKFAIALTDKRRELEGIQIAVGGNTSDIRVYKSMRQDYQGTAEEFDQKLFDHYKSQGGKKFIEDVGGIISHSKFAPLDDWFNSNISTVLRLIDQGNISSTDIEGRELHRAFEVYTTLRDSGLATNMLTGASIIKDTFEQAYNEQGVTFSEKLALALNHPTSSTSGAAAGYAAGLDGGRSSKSNPALTKDLSAALDDKFGDDWTLAPAQIRKLLLDQLYNVARPLGYLDEQAYTKKNIANKIMGLVDGAILTKDGFSLQPLSNIHKGFPVDLDQGDAISYIADDIADGLAFPIFRDAQAFVAESNLDPNTIAWDVLGGFGVVDKDFRLLRDFVTEAEPGMAGFISEANDQLLKRIALQNVEMAEAFGLEIPAEIDAVTEYWKEEGKLIFVDSIYGWFGVGEDVTLEGVWERAPQKLLTHLRSQGYEPDEATPFYTRDSLHIVMLNDGSTYVQAKQPDGTYEPLFSTILTSSHLSVDTTKAMLDKFQVNLAINMKYEEDRATAIMRSSAVAIGLGALHPDDRTRGEFSKQALQMDAVATGVANTVARDFVSFATGERNPDYQMFDQPIPLFRGVENMVYRAERWGVKSAVGVAERAMGIESSSLLGRPKPEYYLRTLAKGYVEPEVQAPLERPTRPRPPLEDAPEFVDELEVATRPEWIPYTDSDKMDFPIRSGVLNWSDKELTAAIAQRKHGVFDLSEVNARRLKHGQPRYRNILDGVQGEWGWSKDDTQSWLIAGLEGDPDEEMKIFERAELAVHRQTFRSFGEFDETTGPDFAAYLSGEYLQVREDAHMVREHLRDRQDYESRQRAAPVPIDPIIQASTYLIEDEDLRTIDVMQRAKDGETLAGEDLALYSKEIIRKINIKELEKAEAQKLLEERGLEMESQVGVARAALEAKVEAAKKIMNMPWYIPEDREHLVDEDGRIEREYAEWKSTERRAEESARVDAAKAELEQHVKLWDEGGVEGIMEYIESPHQFHVAMEAAEEHIHADEEGLIPTEETAEALLKYRGEYARVYNEGGLQALKLEEAKLQELMGTAESVMGGRDDRRRLLLVMLLIKDIEDLETGGEIGERLFPLPTTPNNNK